MVQRTRLVIILLLALAVSFLSAQESGFKPPSLASEAVLELPYDWAEDYSPMETIILVSIKADSTTTLVKILDGKTELQPLIENLIPALQFIPAFVEGKAIDASLTLKLSLVKSQQARAPYLKAVSDSLRQVDKTVLNNWINRQRKSENLQEAFGSDTGADAFTPDANEIFYRTNFYMMGLNNRSRIVLKDGFIQPTRLFYDAPAYQMYSNFRRVRVEGSVISFANDKYDLPVMLTDVYAGLGDYEFNFARVQVVKNHLLGIEDFYTEVGLLVQNGWWQEVISDQTSNRIFLSVPVKNTALSFNYEKYDEDVPSTSLLPGMVRSGLFTIGHKLQSMYLKWQLPWFTAGWSTETDKYYDSETSYYSDVDYDLSNIIVSKDFSSSIADGSLTYQNNYRRSNNYATKFHGQKLAEHQALIKTSKQFKLLFYEIQAKASEKFFEDGTVNTGLRNRIGSFGLYYHFYNDKQYQIMQTTFTNDPDWISDLTFTKHDAAFKYQTPWFDNEFLSSISLGVKEYHSTSSEVDAAEGGYDVTIEQFTDNILYLETNLKFIKKLGRYSARYEQTIQLQQYDEHLVERPELQAQARFKLTRDMGYDNTLSCGLNLTGHTDYNPSLVAEAPVYGSLIADAWLGVKITDLFEFQLIMKNIGDNNIYGLYPHPRTILGTIHWFYLN